MVFDVLRWSQDSLLRLCVRLVAHLVKERNANEQKPLIDADFTYRLLKIPFNVSCFVNWTLNCVKPVSFHVKPHWYKVVRKPDVDTTGCEGSIIVRTVKNEQPRYSRLETDGIERCLHHGVGQMVAILEARLFGKPGSVFCERFPKGAEVGHLLRFPTFATVREILPSMLIALAAIHDQVKYEEPHMLYLYVLLDDSFDEYTLHCDDTLVL